MPNLRELLKRIPFTPFHDGPPVVGILPLSGVIGQTGRFRRGLTLQALARPIERTFALRGLKAVALLINSPGGSPVQSALICKRIRALAEEKSIPVYAFAEDVAASGGYLLALAGDEIFAADESSILGSIGVISAGFGFAGVLEKLGVERRLYTAGEKKSLLDPFSPENPDDVRRLKAVQVEIHDHFKALVTERRGDRLKADPDELFSGEFWAGRQAVEKGLIDGIGDARTVMRERYGKKVRFRTVESQRSWLRQRLGMDEAAHLGGAVDGLVSAIEARALWARFGL